MLSFREIVSTGSSVSDARHTGSPNVAPPLANSPSPNPGAAASSSTAPKSSHARAYQRLIGYECRSDASAANRSTFFSKFNTPSDLPNTYPADLLFVTSDGHSETRIFSVSHTFPGHPKTFSAAAGGSQHHLVDPASAVVLPKRELAALNGYRDIVHASCSYPGPHGEVVVIFTERSPSIAVVGNVPVFEYRLFLHLVGTHIYEEITLHERLGATTTKQFLQVGYFIRSDPKKSSFYFLRSCDHALSGLQFREVVCKRKVEKAGGGVSWQLEVRGESETAWSLVSHPLWHQWDPFLQRIYFWGVSQNHAFLVYRIDGHPERRSFEFEHKTHRLKFQLQQGLPLTTPWAATGSSSTARNHMVVVPIHYECDTVDYALCQQLLPTNVGTTSSNNASSPQQQQQNSQPSSPANNNNRQDNSQQQQQMASSSNSNNAGPLRVACSITLLRNYMDTVEKMEIDLGRPLMQPGDTDPSDAFGRIVFLFVRGMLVLYLPGYFVHYVDVSHPDAPPRYLFGGPIDGIPRRSMSSTSGTTTGTPLIPVSGSRSGSELPTPYGSLGGRTGGGGLLARPDVTTNSGSHTRWTGDNNQGTGSFGVDGNNHSRANSNGLTQRNGSDTAVALTTDAVTGVPTIPALFTTAVARLPVPSGNWVFVPGTTTIAQVDLSLQSLWNYIGDVLAFLHRPSASEHEASSLRNAIHVASTHFTPSAPNSEHDLSSTEHYIEQILMDPEQRRSLRFPVLVNLLLGVAYNVSRHQCRRDGNPYFRCLSFEDERWKDEWREAAPVPHMKKVLQTQASVLQNWDLSFQSRRTSERASPIHHSNNNNNGGNNYNVVSAYQSGDIILWNPSLRVQSPAVQFTGHRDSEKHVRDTHDNTDRDWWIARVIKVQHSTLLGRIRSITKAGTVTIARVPTVMQRSFAASVGGNTNSGTFTDSGNMLTSSHSLPSLERANSSSGAFTSANSTAALMRQNSSVRSINNNNNGTNGAANSSTVYCQSLSNRLSDRQIPSDMASQTSETFYKALCGALSRMLTVARNVTNGSTELSHGDLFFLEQLALASQHIGIPPDPELLARQTTMACQLLPGVVLLQTQKSGLCAVHISDFHNTDDEPSLGAPLDRIVAFERATRVRYGQTLTDAERQGAESARSLPLLLQSGSCQQLRRGRNRLHQRMMPTLDEWQSMVAANCVASCVDTRGARESHLMNFEAGPWMQRNAPSYIPASTFSTPVKFAPFSTWFATVDHAASCTAGTATVRRERAKEVISFALKPFV